MFSFAVVTQNWWQIKEGSSLRRSLRNFEKWGIWHWRPHFNGQVEGFVDTFKIALKKVKGETHMDQIKKFLMIYQITLNLTTGLTLLEMMMGLKIKMVPDLVFPACWKFGKSGEKHDAVDDKQRWRESVSRRVYEKEMAERSCRTEGCCSQSSGCECLVEDTCKSFATMKRED